MISFHGQMPIGFGSRDTLYTCTNSGGVRIDSLIIVNEHTGQIGINLWHKDNFVDFAISVKNQQLASGAQAYFPLPIYMKEGDTIEGEVDTAGSIAPFSLMGVELGRDAPAP